MTIPSRSLLWPSFVALIGCASATPSTSLAPEPAQARAQATVQLSAPQEHAYTAEFFPGTSYDAAISTPDAVLGFRLGDQPAHHEQVLACWRTWAAQSKRVKLETYGRTHEGRELVCGVIASEAHLRDLESILARLGKLADPRTLAPGEAESIAASTPAVAWLGYSIHGDEMSGVDGGLALAHHLIAGTSRDVADLLEQVVVVVDPMQNPDGRERFLAMLLQASGSTPVLDGEALSHGRWPGGRGNHYLFDMNRDWMTGVAPETRGRWAAVRRFHPQLFVDGHEMGRDDSYLFYPQADPVNPHLPQRLIEWQTRYAADIASAFDRYGWSYYTREWADGWGPFYSDSWGSLNGAIGILYEQARYDGQTVKLSSGEVRTYREAAHHQAVASLSNVATLANAREEVLRDFAAHRKSIVEAPLERPFFVVEIGANAAREQAFLSTLIGQGVEVRRTSGVGLSGAIAADGTAQDSLEIAGDVWVVDGHQPQGALVRAFLEFDTRYPKSDLERERKELETKNSSRIYDSTAWDLGHALGLKAWWSKGCATSHDWVGPLTEPPRIQGSIVAAPDANARVYGWIVDGVDDGSVVFAARAMASGLVLSLADEPFESCGRKFARGSLLVRGHENGANAAELVQRAAEAAHVTAYATNSARAPGSGHDLGGQHFLLLAKPKIAMLTNSPVSSQAFGHLWHQIDRELGLPVSLLDAQDLGSYDLRRYNVLVLPPAGGLGDVLESAGEPLKDWVRAGGTLVAIGGSAGALCRGESGFTSVKHRADVLDKLEEYRFAAKREQAAGTTPIDEGALWDGKPAKPSEPAPAEGEKKDDAKPKESGVDPDKEREERWKQRFSPQGVFLRGLVRGDHWITSGAERELPVFFDESLSLWSRSPTSTPVRLAPAETLRLSGLLWPEARERLAESAYLTVERLGNGQVILFAAQPGFRGFHRATGRLFANAVVYGPGAGTNPSRDR
jgi:hypothetical protein